MDIYMQIDVRISLSYKPFQKAVDVKMGESLFWMPTWEVFTAEHTVCLTPLIKVLKTASTAQRAKDQEHSTMIIEGFGKELWHST